MRAVQVVVLLGFASLCMAFADTRPKLGSPMVQVVDGLITATARVEPDRTISIDIQNHGAETVVAWTADIAEYRRSGSARKYFYSHDYVQTNPQAPVRGIARNSSTRYKVPMQSEGADLPVAVEIAPTAVVLESNVAFGTENAVDAIFTRRENDRKGFEEAKVLLLGLKGSKPSLSANQLLAAVAALRSPHLTAVNADHIAEDMALLLRTSAASSDAFGIALSAVEANRARAAKGSLRARR